MNVLDVFIALPLVYGAVHGWHRGLIREALSLIGVGVSFFIANTYHPLLHKKMLEALGDAVYTHSAVAYGLCFAASIVAMNIVARLLSKLAEKVDLGSYNAFFGSLFGLSKWLLLMAFLLVGAGMLQRKLEWPDTRHFEDSVLFRPVESLGELMIHRAPDSLEEQVQEAIPEWASTASMPGSPRPSKYSSIAPPPVLT